jgi:hypothetical protein
MSYKMFGGEGLKINSLEIGNACIRQGRAGQIEEKRRERPSTRCFAMQMHRTHEECW